MRTGGFTDGNQDYIYNLMLRYRAKCIYYEKLLNKNYESKPSGIIATNYGPIISDTKR